jgi:hypothetical protein
MGVSQIGGEHREALFDIHTGFVPMKECRHGESVTKVM